MKRDELERLAVRKYRDPGDALAGERVIAQARKIRTVKSVPGTSAHRMQETILSTNVLCVLDREFRPKRLGPKLQKKD